MRSVPESRGTEAVKKPFNNPFQKLKLPPKEEKPKAPPPKPPPPPPPRREGLTEDELWQMAIDGAAPLADRKERIRELMVALFEELGQDDPLATQFRRRLATALY